METGNGEISVTVKANSIPELVGKLQKILGQYKAMQPIQGLAQGQEIDFPQHIKELYPDYGYNSHSAAMLTALYANHKGKANAVTSSDLAKEMKQIFPNLFAGKTEGEISAGNVLPGNVLLKKGLIKKEVRKEGKWEYRVYWI
jgi:hypothetical protein